MRPPPEWHVPRAYTPAAARDAHLDRGHVLGARHEALRMVRRQVRTPHPDAAVLLEVLRVLLAVQRQTQAGTPLGPRPPVDPAHRKLRAQLLPHAIGTPCPDCGRIMDQTAELDHIIPRSQGGTSTRDNVRITCRACNRRRGSQLGGRVAHRAHRAGRPPAVWRSSNW